MGTESAPPLVEAPSPVNASAADFAMDHLKSDAWFWKREKRADGWHWIDPREQDHADLARWR